MSTSRYAVSGSAFIPCAGLCKSANPGTTVFAVGRQAKTVAAASGQDTRGLQRKSRQ